MIGLIDCCKWQWDNSPTACHRQYKGKKDVSKSTMEAVSDDLFYFWHILCGMAGCKNNVSVLKVSIILGKISDETYPRPAEYEESAKK